MFTWTTITIISGALTGCGVALDKFLLPRHKSALHNVMTYWWVKLDDTKIPDLAKLMANWTLNSINRVLKWPFLSWKYQSIIVIICSSFLLTSCFSLVGLLLDNINRIDQGFGLPWYPFYLVNLLFDCFTIFITIKILSVVRKSNFLISLGVILIDIILAAVLTILCFASILVASDFAHRHTDSGLSSPMEEKVNEFYKLALEDIIKREGFSDNVNIKIYNYKNFFGIILDFLVQNKKFITTGNLKSKHKHLSKVVLSENDKVVTAIVESPLYIRFGLWLTPFTTFIPTLIYMSVLMVIIIGKLFIVMAQKIIMHYLELATHSDPVKDPKEFMPATLIGLLFGVISIIAKTVQELINLYS